MDLKDYIRIIRRRFLEFIGILIFIFLTYLYMSQNEIQKYLANVNLRVGERVSSSLDEPNILFLRNRKDLANILNNKGPNSVYHEAAHHIRYKIELAQSVDSIEDLPESQKKLFYITQKREGLIKKETHESNFKDLMIGVSKLTCLIKNREDEITLDTLEDEIARICRQITLTNSTDQDSNVLTLNLKTEEINVARWLANEVAFYVSNKFNKLNSENAVTRMRQIDHVYDSFNRDGIERRYNEIVFLYRDHLSNNDPIHRENIQTTLNEKYKFKNFEDAFNVDDLRRNLKKIIEVGWRLNNARTYGNSGLKTLSDERAKLSETQRKLQDLQTEQINLDKERLLLQMKFEEFSEEQVEAYLKTSENMQTLQDQLSEAQLNLNDLEQNYTEHHPKVINAVARVKKIKAITSDLELRFRDNDKRRYAFRLREINFQKNFNVRLISDLKIQEQALQTEVQRLQDMEMYLDVIQTDYRRLLDQSAALTNELQGLKRIVEFQRIVHVDRPASKSFMLPKTYTRQTMWLTIVAGVIASMGIVYAREYMDTRIKTEHDVRRHLNLPIISVIQKARSSELLLSDMAFKEPLAENFNAMGTLIQSTAKDLNLKSLLVTSTLPKEGKTTIAINLSESLARMGLKVLLIDGDFRIPRVHEYLKLDNTIGISTWVLEKFSNGRLQGVPLSKILLQAPNLENLHVLSSGPVLEDPLQLVSSKRLHQLLARAKEHYDFVIVDSPPIYNVADALKLATHTDATVFVVGSELVEQDQVTWAKHLLENVNANILGTVLNYVRFSGRSYYYYYNGYKSYRARG